MYFSEILAAGAAGAKEIAEAGDFFRILASAAEDLTVTFYKAGREVGTVQAVGAGYYEKIDFDKVRFSSVAGGQVNIVTRIGAEVGYDRAVGSVQVSGTITTKDENGAFTHGAPAVGAASSQLLAANVSRRYLLIQNNHATEPIYVKLDGGVVVVGGAAIRIRPGESLEIQGRAPTSAINGVAANALAASSGVVVVEG